MLPRGASVLTWVPAWLPLEALQLDAATLRDVGEPAGFDPVPTKTGSRAHRVQEFVADVEAAGLRVRLGSYELHPPRDDYAVWVHGRSAPWPVRPVCG